MHTYVICNVMYVMHSFAQICHPLGLCDISIISFISRYFLLIVVTMFSYSLS